ncbi:MAG TPA: hypothetical protein VGH99_03545 [Pseudonocardia sp.]
MRTLISVVVGLLLLVAVAALARRRGPGALPKALTAFMVVWFVLCVMDTAIGVASGHSLLEELLVHLLIVAVPAVAAYLLARRSPAGPG